MGFVHTEDGTPSGTTSVRPSYGDITPSFSVPLYSEAIMSRVGAAGRTMVECSGVWGERYARLVVIAGKGVDDIVNEEVEGDADVEKEETKKNIKVRLDEE